MKILYNLDTMKFMALFDNVTHSPLKDCFELNETLYFVVSENNIGRAVGPEGKNVRRLEALLKRKIKVVEFRANMIEFLTNLVYPVKIDMREDKDGILTVRAHDSKGRGMLIGRNASNLRLNEKIMQRYYPIKELKVE